MLALVFLLPAALAVAVVPPSHEIIDTRQASPGVSPNGTCGLVVGGANQGYTCPGEIACCSQFGYCGSTDEFCLNTNGCQTRYSNTSTSCQSPRSGVSISPDGTCGSTGAGKHGYRCPSNTTSCCSAAGYCGDSSDHCDINLGCQEGFGKCTGKKSSTRSFDFVDFVRHTVRNGLGA